MSGFGYVLVGLGLGLALGAAVATWRRAAGARDAARLEARLDVQSAEIRRLADAGSARDGEAERIRAEVAAAGRALRDLVLREEERRERERDSWEVVRRLSTVLAGGTATGRAGENVLREHLAELPPGMLVNDFRVNGRVVEFGLLLPDGRRLPVDSKWTAIAELEALEAAEDPSDREARARQVERAVATRVREVAQYLDPALTAPVAVAAVPDAAYAVLRHAHADAFAKGVVIVPYSTALPVLLFLHSLVARYGDAGDLHTALREVAGALEAMEQVLEHKFARATAMLANGADEMRSHLGKALGSVAAGRSAGPAPDGRPIGEEAMLEAVR
jgi:hypothetical protein